MARLLVDEAVVSRCRELASAIAADVQATIDAHTSVGVERTVARAYGVSGADPEGTPLANALIDRIHKAGKTGRGVARYLGAALADGASGIQGAAERLAYGEELPDLNEGSSLEAARRASPRSNGAPSARRRSST